MEATTERNTTMKIKEQFRKDGFNFQLIKRKGNWAIFEKFKDKNTPSYEIVKIRKRTKDSKIQGKLVSRKGDEYYPCSSEWGTYGFTATSLEYADKLLHR